MTDEVTIKEAAERLGVSVDTVRRRLKAGELEGTQEPHGKSGYRWLVHLPDDAPGMPPADAYEHADTRARIDGLERLIDELATERDAWKEQAQRESEASRELRHLLRSAQDTSRALTATLEPVDVAHGPQRPSDAPQTSETGRRGLWARVRRWIVREG